ncbi:MAG: peptidoglycan editing factor PgeF [Alphaproteobacteria bacterium]|nr:peptidoglycan editing factor PgeF [Alphaproteobacteria bacterium]
MIEPLSAANLSALPRVRHAFFTRAHGNGGFSGQENPQDVHETRAHMAAHLTVLPENLLSAYQIHSPDVVVVTKIWQADDRPRADALVTDRSGIALGVLTADCVPVLFADQDAGVIGAAHAGWRGAVGGVLENTLAAMERLGAGAGRVQAALGPCIWQASYEVGPDFPAPFIAQDAAYMKFFAPSVKDGHYMFDLPAYIRERLRRAGVASVAASPGDTCAAPDRFYSHRYSTLHAEKRDGNLMSAITLLP